MRWKTKWPVNHRRAHEPTRRLLCLLAGMIYHLNNQPYEVRLPFFVVVVKINIYSPRMGGCGEVNIPLLHMDNFFSMLHTSQITCLAEILKSSASRNAYERWKSHRKSCVLLNELEDYKKTLFKQIFVLLGMASSFIDGIFSAEAETINGWAILFSVGCSAGNSTWLIHQCCFF